MNLLGLKDYSEGSYILTVSGFEEEVMRFKKQFETEHIRLFKTYCEPDQKDKVIEDVVNHLVSTGINRDTIETLVKKSDTNPGKEVDIEISYRAEGPSYGNFNPNSKVHPLDYMYGNGLECDIPLESTKSILNTRNYFNKSREPFEDTTLTYVYEIFEEGCFTDPWNVVLEMSRQYPGLELSLDMIDTKAKTTLFRVVKNMNIRAKGTVTNIEDFKNLTRRYNLSIFMEECPYCNKVLFLDDVNNSNIEAVEESDTSNAIGMFNHTCCDKKVVIVKEEDYVYLDSAAYIEDNK